MKIIVVFQLSHNTTPYQDKLTRFSSSVRRPKKAGKVRDDMSTWISGLSFLDTPIYRYNLALFKLTVLGKRFRAFIWVRVMDTKF